MSDKKVLAVVAGEEITEDQLTQYLVQLPQEQQAYAGNPYFRQQVLEQIVNTRLMAKLGEEQKLEETEEFAEKMAVIRKDVLAQLAIRNIVQAVTATEEEAAAYYEAHKQEYQKPETVGAKHILVEDEATAVKVAEEIQNGTYTFEQAAGEYSTCPSKAQGGDLGEFGHGQMVKEFDEAAFAAEIDVVTAPVKTQFGYHLIKVYKKSEAGETPYEEVAGTVKSKLLNEKRNAAIQVSLKELRERFM